MHHSQKLGKVKTGVVAAAFFVLAAQGAYAQGAPQMPPPAVGVLELKAQPLPVVSELPGRVAATRVSEVRARVSGILEERVFQQGALVEKGDVLYKIDSRLFRVRVDSAKAALLRAEAVRDNAKVQYERQKALRDRNVTSGFELDTAAVNLAQAEADVLQAQATLEEAQINLDYTEVRAPITGIIGGALVTEGALVTADGPSNLALIQQIDPVYVDFTQSAQDLISLKRAVSQGKLESPQPGQASVKLLFDGGDVYPEKGKLLFSSAGVDPSTGQVTLRAEFPNTSNELLPGMYVRIRIEQAVRQDGITIPQRAVLRTSDGKPQAYIVDAEGKAQLRDLELGQSIGQDWVVEEGLKAGEKVIVDGVQKVQPEAKVVPEPWTPDQKQPDAADKAPEAPAN